MKKVFQIVAPEGFDWVLPVDERDFETLRFDGRPRRSSWRPVRMRPLTVGDRGQVLAASDFPSCSGSDMVLLRRGAFDALSDLFSAYGELLPLECTDGQPLWTLNVTTLLDALDEDRSSVLRLPGTGEILRVRVPAFKPEIVASAEVFKLSCIPRGLIYVTESVVNQVKSMQLMGMDFKPVWSLD